MDDDLRALARVLLDAAPCAAILPAGCGKTELVAAAGRVAAERSKRLLILTHTHAGVEALRRRLRRFEVKSKDMRVATIDGWALPLARAFPVLGGWDGSAGLPSWPYTHSACLQALKNPHVLDMVQRSYDCVVVDEYQDCSLTQHAVIMQIAQVLPVVILGDPLQAIYGFGGNALVEWDRDLAHLPMLPLPVLPWRWRGHNDDLGEFLFIVRARLESGEPIDLNSGPVAWVAKTDQHRRALCWSHVSSEGSVVLLQQFDAQCEMTARGLGGHFGVMEDLEGSLLLKVAGTLGSGGVKYAGSVLLFAFSCHANLPAGLKAKGQQMANGTFPNYQSGSAMAPTLDVFKRLAQRPNALGTLAALEQIESLGGTRFRNEAWRDFRRAAALWGERGPATALVDAVRSVRDRSRLLGRVGERRVVSRPVLVKGLEYDHACVLDADRLNAKELYVALTRARRSLAVMSGSPILDPS
jgi:hypothetical protein